MEKAIQVGISNPPGLPDGLTPAEADLITAFRAGEAFDRGAISVSAGAAAFLRKGGLSHEVAETIRRVAESPRDAQ